MAAAVHPHGFAGDEVGLDERDHRLGDLDLAAPAADRFRKILFYTVSNTSSLVQYGGIGALEGSQDVVDDSRRELAARRELFYAGIRDKAAGILTGEPPAGAFYAFLRIDPAWRSPMPDPPASLSWAMTEFLIRKGRIGCVPGVDFGPRGEAYVRFCFARDRAELAGALDSMKELLQEVRVIKT